MLILYSDSIVVSEFRWFLSKFPANRHEMLQTLFSSYLPNIVVNVAFYKSINFV